MLKKYCLTRESLFKKKKDDFEDLVCAVFTEVLFFTEDEWEKYTVGLIMKSECRAMGNTETCMYLSSSIVSYWKIHSM